MRFYFSMLRVPNLLIIVLLYVLLRYLVFVPVYETYSLTSQLTQAGFLLMVLSTVLTAAAGYLANDYFDVVTDRVNKPGKVYIGSRLTPGATLATALWFSLLSVATAILFACITRTLLPLLLLLTALGVVWWYAMRLKRSLFLGNLAVASMSAGTLLLAWVSEYTVTPVPVAVSQQLGLMVGGVSVFAFMLSLMREIVKDAEDQEGDRIIGCRSLPLVKGLPFTHRFLHLLNGLTFMLLIAAQIVLSYEGLIIVVLWLVAGVELPLVFFSLMLRRATVKADYHRLSILLKWIMLAGILSLAAGHLQHLVE
jgi:4-hydroxybenzoate polyprenyltransferase